MCGGAGVAAGTIVLVAVGPRRVLYEVGLVKSPDRQVPASGWPVVEHTLASAAMKRDVPWAIAVPPGEVSGVVVCLHGRNGDHRFAFDTVRLHDVVAHLGVSLAVVGVDGGEHSYWHPRADGTDALSMVTSELLDAIDVELGATVSRAVLGWSMGGYGALLAAEHPTKPFRAVVAVSPALWPSFGEAPDGAFDSANHFERFDVFNGVGALSSLVVRIDCGTDDQFLAAAKRFAGMLSAPNRGRFSAGFHDDRYYRSIAADQITTIAEALT